MRRRSRSASLASNGLSKTNSFSEDHFQKSYTIVTHFADSYLGKIRSKKGKQFIDMKRNDSPTMTESDKLQNGF